MQITVSRGRLFMWVQNTSNSNFYTETIQRYATAMEQIFNSLYLIYLFRQQHCISHRVDFKSARGVVGGVDGAYGYLRAPVVSRCTIISFTLHRAASRSLQKAGHWRNVSIPQPTVHIDVTYNKSCSTKCKNRSGAYQARLCLYRASDLCGVACCVFSHSSDSQ